jgi:uncharacterized protein YrrD
MWRGRQIYGLLCPTALASADTMRRLSWLEWTKSTEENMRVGKELVGKPIYSVDEGRQIGKVKDLYIDSGLNRIIGIHLGSEGLIRRKSLLVPGEDVLVLGVDAVLVRRSDATTDDSNYVPAKEWLRREKLDGRQVDTPGGTKLGTIGDIIVDRSGNISGFILGRIFVEGPLADKRTVDRSVVLDTGQDDGVMTIDLPALEAMLLGSPAAAVDQESPESIEILVEQESATGMTAPESATMPDTADEAAENPDSPLEKVIEEGNTQ